MVASSPSSRYSHNRKSSTHHNVLSLVAATHVHFPFLLILQYSFAMYCRIHGVYIKVSPLSVASLQPTRDSQSIRLPMVASERRIHGIGEIDVWSFYPLLPTPIAPDVPDIELDHMVTITTPGCVAAHRTIVRFLL